MPRVSVIIPSYNHAQFIEERLKSVFNQTFDDYEIIFLDDASTDNSVEIFYNLKNEKCTKEFINRENSGSLYKQWNRGVKEAKGEYLWLAESDDWADKKFLEEMVSLLDKTPQVGMAYCRSNYIDNEGHIIEGNKEWASDIDPVFWEEDFVMEGEDFASNFLILNNVVNNTSSSLIRKEIWDMAGTIDEGIKYCGDWMQWARIAKLSDIAYLSQRLNYYRYHDTTVRVQYLKSHAQYGEMYKVFRYINDNFNVSKHIREIRLDRLCEEWVGKLIYNSKLNEAQKFKYVIKLYQELKLYDSSLLRRVLRNLLTGYREKTTRIFKSKV